MNVLNDDNCKHSLIVSGRDGLSTKLIYTCMKINCLKRFIDKEERYTDLVDYP